MLSRVIARPTRSWRIEDAEVMAGEVPALRLPPRAERMALRPGTCVRLFFGDEAGNVEEGKVVVTGRWGGGKYVGVVDGRLSLIKGIDRGRRVAFAAANISGWC